MSAADFQDIGTPGDYLRTSTALAQREGDHLISGRGVEIAPTARLRGTAVWDDVLIAAGVTLVDCVVGDGVRIPAGAHYERCAIVPATGRAPRPGERMDGELLLAAIE